MKRVSKLKYSVGFTIIYAGIAFSAGIPNNDHPTTFVGPTLKASTTNLATNRMAYSVAGEAGAKNLRIGGTVGWQIDPRQIFKVSADYLTQDINYSFFSGNSTQWVNQSSISAGYLYDLYQYQYYPEFLLNGYLSHAPSKNLSTRVGTFNNSAGVLQIFANNRRIAGSNAGGISPGVSIAPWIGGRVGVELNYDNVRYDKIYSPNQNAIGVGGTIKLKQAITDNVVFDTSAAVRQPFNNYEARLIWNIPYYGIWGVGVFGDYVVGKKTLPNTYNVGINVNYSFDRPVACRGRSPVRTDLHSFTANPGVYLPQVLAIADERVAVVTPVPPVVCSPVPALIGTIPTLDDNVITTFDASSVFSPSSGLNYSIVVTPSPTPPGSVTINPTTGVITIVGAAVTETLTAVVTARNNCGSVSSNTFTIVLND